MLLLGQQIGVDANAFEKVTPASPNNRRVFSSGVCDDFSQRKSVRGPTYHASHGNIEIICQDKDDVGLLGFNTGTNQSQ